MSPRGIACYVEPAHGVAATDPPDIVSPLPGRTSSSHRWAWLLGASLLVVPRPAASGTAGWSMGCVMSRPRRAKE